MRVSSSKSHALKSGYGYRLKGGGDWRTGSSEPWEVRVLTPNGKETLVGFRSIDGVECAVFVCCKGKPVHYAQTASFCKAEP